MVEAAAKWEEGVFVTVKGISRITTLYDHNNFTHLGSVIRTTCDNYCHMYVLQTLVYCVSV